MLMICKQAYASGPFSGVATAPAGKHVTYSQQWAVVSKVSIATSEYYARFASEKLNCPMYYRINISSAFGIFLDVYSLLPLTKVSALEERA